MSELLPNRDIDLRGRGGLLFTESTHTYENADGVIYKGMTTFMKPFCGEFDAMATAGYKAMKDNIPPDKMKKFNKSIGGWQNAHLYFDTIVEKRPELGVKLIKTRQEHLDSWELASHLGSLEHDRREKEVIENGFTYKGIHYPYLDKTVLDLTKDDIGVVPEIMVWDHYRKLCGLIDLPLFYKGTCLILDYKTNKEITTKGFMGKRMSGPFKNHPDCSLAKYSGQLYGYQKMLCDLTGFEPGECTIISTASELYKRPEDIYMTCIDVSKEIEEAFNEIL